MIITFISIVVLVAFAYACSWIDDEHYDKKEWVKDKTSRVVQRAIFIAALSLAQQEFWWSPLLAFFAYGCIFGAIFDLTLNQVREFKIMYIGSTAESDKLIQKNPWLNTWGRSGLFIIGTFILWMFF